MTLEYEPIETYFNQTSTTTTILQGRRLVLAHIAGSAITIFAILLFIITIPRHAAHLHVVCTRVTCEGIETTAEIARQLQTLGLSLSFYNTYTQTLQMVFALTYFVVAAIIVWRKFNDWMALLGALFLLTFAVLFTNVPNVLAQDYPTWWLPVRCLEFLAEMAFPLFFYLFPNGQFVPHWTRWLLIGWVLWAIIDTFFHDAPFSRSAWFLTLESLLFVIGLSSMIQAQVYRYRYVSGLAQRQQTKWVVFGMGIGLGGFFVSGIFGFILPAVLFPSLALVAMPSPALMGTIAITVSYITMLFIPLSLLMAILRTQLWEIDGIVSRTLLYGSLTGVLALIYIGSIMLLQHVFRPFTSQDDLVLIAATLAIVALFQPLQRRLQKVIDRCFYRQKYDATQALELFSATLQGETDLTQLSEQLIDVVEEAMQPAHVALWLRHSEPGTAVPKYTRHLRL